MRSEIERLKDEMPYYEGNADLTAACQDEITALEDASRRDGAAARAAAAAEARAARNT
jgi:hypothetical protein